jgi:hypothetical protein
MRCGRRSNDRPERTDYVASDASAQPIVQPMREENTAKSLRGHLNDLLMGRTWPGSL